ncbi:hypothetical protein F2Q68_00044667 [Brassica cretica]|uniref:Uncharacterized protein n=1 Tax=Brassica cretica TaxID=69181 RepID=A0A8S9LNI5_BRACR|nr:hypothetical protein F2Q68_00044667 [Brassica cretica]
MPRVSASSSIDPEASMRRRSNLVGRVIGNLRSVTTAIVGDRNFSASYSKSSICVIYLSISLQICWLNTIFISSVLLEDFLGETLLKSTAYRFENRVKPTDLTILVVFYWKTCLPGSLPVAFSEKIYRKINMREVFH